MFPSIRVLSPDTLSCTILADGEPEAGGGAHLSLGGPRGQGLRQQDHGGAEEPQHSPRLGWSDEVDQVQLPLTRVQPDVG